MGLPKLSTFLLAALLLLKAQEAGRLPRSCASAIARLKQTVWISTRHDISLGWSGCRLWLSIKWDLYLLDLFSTTECCVPIFWCRFFRQFNGKFMTSPKNRRISTAININHYQNDPKWSNGSFRWRLGTTQGLVFSFQHQLSPYTHESHQIQLLIKLECLARSCRRSRLLSLTSLAESKHLPETMGVQASHPYCPLSLFTS